MIRRPHYSTALTQAQAIFTESAQLFELWQEGMSATPLFELARVKNVFGSASERRLRNIVIEGFASRFLRDPIVESAPTLKQLFDSCPDLQLLRQINLLYTARQHGILFDFIKDEYWPRAATHSAFIEPKDIHLLIDKGMLQGKLTRNWSDSVRKRVSSYVLGTATDLELLGPPKSGRRPIEFWRPSDKLLVYLAYDLHFYGYSDDEIASSAEWQLLGLSRRDVSECFTRLQQRGHWIIQDTGHLMRIEWTYQSRKEMGDALDS